MSWQDELEQLDNELAEGKIDAGEHRRRADDLLAGASGPTAGPAAGWRSQSPSRNAERDTQQLRPPWERGPAVGKTEAEPEKKPVPEQTPQELTNPIPPVPPVEPQKEPAKEPTFPPVPQPAVPQAVQQPPWQRQQRQPSAPVPELPEPKQPRRKLSQSGKLLLAGVGGVLVLALIALLVWLLAFRNVSESAPQRQAPPPSPASTEATGPAVLPSGLAERLPKLPGVPLKAPDMQPIDSIVKAGYYTEQIAQNIQKAGPKSMLVRQSVRSGTEVYLLAVIPSTSQRNCQLTAAGLNDFQRSLGFTDTHDGMLGANTSTLNLSNKQGVYYRGAYCSDRMTVLVASATAKLDKADSLKSGYAGFGKSVAKALPPN
ncbi:hypothetical protein [Sciscionella sediminilitoris]|uniref:hypothetical protein n=1 Tax=Sciscionella sediminilitoris TaxID=1445613 RepID=UPI00056D0340|nr:hypothetical protein [Sciscionella sp. SE31]